MTLTKAASRGYLADTLRLRIGGAQAPARNRGFVDFVLKNGEDLHEINSY
jgi:hypothetical protein